MKKLITILGAMALCGSTSINIIACERKEQLKPNIISNFYVLGDSLSDTGAGVGGKSEYLNNIGKPTFKMSIPYYKSRSWCNGKVASELIAEKLKVNFEPSWEFTLDSSTKQTRTFEKIGSNYAVGGAVADSDNQNSLIQTFDIEHQADMLLNQHNLIDNDAIWIEIGANDIASLMKRTSTSDISFIKEKINRVLEKAAAVINKLIVNGAKNLIVSDVPDLTLTPQIKELVPNKTQQEFASKTCLQYQESWRKMILEMQKLHPNIIKPFYLSQELRQNMKIFPKVVNGGVTNISAGVGWLDLKSDTQWWKANQGVKIKDISKYFYFDKFHPNAWFHQQMANHILQLL